MTNCLLDLNLPTVEREAAALHNPDREPLRILVIGSRDGVIEIIHDLHRRSFAEVNLWSPLLPTPNLHEVMSILTRYRKREG